MRAIQYRLTDAFADPCGETEAFHSEKLVRIQDCAWCFSPWPDTPQPNLDLNYEGPIRFGCFNNFAKVTDEFLDLCIKLLSKRPDATLYLKARQLSDESLQKTIRSRFHRSGIDTSRLTLSGWIIADTHPLSHYNDIDIALDTFPYNGTTTTCEALYMGVPVITLKGETHSSRVGFSLLKNLGLEDSCVADSIPDYLTKALNLSRSRQHLNVFKIDIEKRIRNSILLDQKSFAQRFAKAIDEIISDSAEELPSGTNP